MILYTHPGSASSHAITMFLANDQNAVDNVIVDAFAGEHLTERYPKLNPKGMVPWLVDDGFVLTEGPRFSGIWLSRRNRPRTRRT